MSIELDWQIVEKDVPPDQPVRPPAPRPRRRLPREWLIAFAVILVAAIAIAAIYIGITYRRQLDRAEREVRPVAKLEAQALAANDLQSFLALQDPEDPNWRAMQEKRFGRLEHVGLPEFGWKAMGVAPQSGAVTLEPGGARLDVTYQFSVTQPMPNGPAVVKLRLPQYYKQTPAGWVRANPSVEYWGGWRTRSGKYFAMRYTQRDTDVLDPLIARMDEMLARICDSLPCPPQPIYIAFENSPEALAGLTDFSYGFDDGAFVLHLPSPQLFGVPADARSCDELYRAIGTRIVQALVTEASKGHPNLPYLFSRQVLQWELAKAGLAGPFITPEITRTLSSSLQADTWQPLTTLSLRARAAGMEPTVDEVMLPSLALAFLEKQVGAGTVERLIPAMQTNVTLGEAISAALKVNPGSLEPAWLAYLRRQAGLPVSQPASPGGELALTCSAGRTSYSVLRVGVDGSTIQVVEGQVQNVPQTTWSPDGKKLAYLRSGQVVVMDADTRQYDVVSAGYSIDGFGWLPDGRLWIRIARTGTTRSFVVNLDTGAENELAGTSHVWSPDGKQMAYLEGQFSTLALWIADADGNNAQQIAPGYEAVWSPDGQRLAFLGDFRGAPANSNRILYGREVQIADVASGSVRTLARSDDLVQPGGASEIGWIGNLAWSPDGSMLAASVNQPNRPSLFVLDADSGVVHARWRGGTGARWVSLAWSADNRHVGFWVMPVTGANVGTVGVLDVATGRAVTLPGRDFDWSPADERGQWLAVAQVPDSVFLVTPDLAAMRWLDTPNCFGVAWRPGNR